MGLQGDSNRQWGSNHRNASCQLLSCLLPLLHLFPAACLALQRPGMSARRIPGPAGGHVAAPQPGAAPGPGAPQQQESDAADWQLPAWLDALDAFDLQEFDGERDGDAWLPTKGTDHSCVEQPDSNPCPQPIVARSQ